MRLKQIKLAGFKSFVDPTAFEVPSQLVGVVGPNGCGKSNVIDAVRWVLGESKASELRGESMQDVIFSGSAERKPAARASVELVFDNTLGRIGGSWAGYAEISVKRMLSRDGQSTYLINNQSVRRKDVHDMFLGTGLGPRAYAIIGQGMISRIIEARPEDLRVFLEEAAGVSRYKERRRETENRLADTRENLTRVEDILRELNAQIEKLERQAEVAAHYRDLEAERDRKQQMLWLMRRDEALTEQARIVEQSVVATNLLEERTAALRSIEAEIERLRSAHYAVTDEVHGAQARFYESNSEVTRLESEIRFVVESQAQHRERVATLHAQITRSAEEHEASLAQAQAAETERVDAEARAEALSEQVGQLSERLPEFEVALRDTREALESARAAAMATRQSIELSATRRHSADERLGQARRRRERLEAEAAQVEAPSQEALDTMAQRLLAAEASEQGTAEALAQADDAWHTASDQRAPAQQALREAESRAAQLDARLTALRQLQERVQSQGKIQPWLEHHGLTRLGHLWQKLRIDHGWETAVESVLRERVSALQVERLDPIAALAGDAAPAKVAFFHAQPGASVPAGASPQGARPLVSLIHTGDAGLAAMIGEWLHGIFAIDSVDAACSRRDALAVGQQFVTPAGHVVDRHSIQVFAPDSEQDGILARQFEIDNLEREQRAQRLLADQARDEAIRIEATASQRTTRLTEARETHNRAVRELAAVRLEAERLDQLSQRAAQTRDRVEAELAEVQAIEQQATAQIDTESEAFDRLDMELAERQQRAEELAERAGQAELTLNEHRERLRHTERQAQEGSFATRELEARIERLRAQADLSARVGDQARSESGQVEARLAELSDETARAGLQEALQARTTAEQGLSQVRQQADDLTRGLRARDEERLTVEREHEPLRQRLTELQLKEQAARLSAVQFEEQLAAESVDEGAVRAAFADATPKASWLQGEVTRLGNAVIALGPVNLAALDELKQSGERKGFLDSQSADLNEAITTLEDAIRKIDRETRDVLQQTYDSVNHHFGKLFPELFGGGDAKLILTGEEILDAGIQVMAHPPGKRNTSIHLLSGGEKALTAIALVFAMFQLNPAPFCLLDEVDAPLDDANTERYCDMVRRMSGQTQFLFITHNKIAMEMALQLVGVTMQERGVSRIVAVDLDAAAQMAEAA